MYITLQQATPGDILRISTLAQRIWRAHYPPIIGNKQVEYMLDLNYSPASLQRQFEAGQMFQLVMDGEEVFGFLSVSDHGEGRYFLHKFYLDNEKRGRGLGKIVFERLLARYPGLRELRLTVNRQNYMSINFYFKIGFVIEKCVDIPIGNGFAMNDFQMLWRRHDVV
ncbi:MAG TPA: GNAT family N-acetyltransferase [Saprospiraceae bacterium]|nr:GNAT family N-acetyltransferase [Saprospiraceae bacterium]